MNLLKVLSLALTILTVSVNAQDNFTYTPEKPKAGELITFTYEPAGDIAGTLSPVEAVAYEFGGKTMKAFDITLTKKDGKYTGTLQTDTAGNFLFFSFAADAKFDNNNNDGYKMLLYDGEKIKKGAYANQSLFYQYYGSNAGVDRDGRKAMQSLEKEFELYPQTKQDNMVAYLRLLSSEDKDKFTTTVQKEIEAALKKGLEKEEDYSYLESLYGIAKLPQQAGFIAGLKKEKYPQGKWVVTETINKFYRESDPAQKQALLNEIIAKSATDPNWTGLQENIPLYKLEIAYAYSNKKDWDGFKKAVANANVQDKSQLASLYNNTAWEMQKENDNLPYAAELAKFAATTAKQEWEKPTAPKPDYMTDKQWEKSRRGAYGMYADTYAMVLYKLGKYKEAYPYTKDAAIKIAEGKSADENNTYALVAEKVLPAKKLKPQLEDFIKNGKATAAIKEILKKEYIKSNKSEAGFDEYVAGLQKESYLALLEELQKAILNQTSPSFALYNLDGSKVAINDLKGKVVVVDFWATWCGPCKASFPAMQKMVTKYKDNQDVKFLFIDTWERVDDKKKNAQDFITKNKYSFNVLLDTEDKVVDQFKVEGIPTKFVIDKEGTIRFKSIGFDGSDDKLIQELTAMIEMAGNPDKKAF
jgi:thiol-disulfide isomerase/thioredoxin